MDNLAEKIIIDILTQEMELDNQSIWIRNQNKKIPPTDGLFIVVGMADAQIISSQNEMVERLTALTSGDGTPITWGNGDAIGSGPEQWEINSVQMRENIQIDLFSRDNSALTRRWEVIAALSSIFSKQQQEQNSFRIFRQAPSFVNISAAEGGSMLNRFSIIIPCFVWYKKEKLLTAGGKQYYDEFGTRVDDEETIGQTEPLFEFEITPDTPPP